MPVIQQLPVPTGDQLMTLVAKGHAECEPWAARIAGWPPDAAVPQIVMNALDPALLELFLGPVRSARLIPLLRRHYADVRARFPGPFADVEQVWRVQRSWWLQFVEAESAPSSGGAVDLVPDSQRTDVLLAHPAGTLYLRGRALRAAPRPVRQPAAPSSSGAPAAPSARASAPALPGQAPTASQTGSLPQPPDPDVEPAQPRAAGASSPSAATPTRPRAHGVYRVTSGPALGTPRPCGVRPLHFEVVCFQQA